MTFLTERVYLNTFLAPLADMLARPDVTDIYVNRPGELWIETLAGEIKRHDAPALDGVGLDRLARQVAACASQGISREYPLLSASLPNGARVQIVAPPATRGELALAIRKHLAPDLTLDDYVKSGALADVVIDGSTAQRIRQTIADQLSRDDVAGALASAVRGRVNILVSGGTSTGKTTFLNALMREIPGDERLIIIEDTPELQLDHANAIGLLAVRGATGEARVTANDLVSASLRMRPDRIILGELRGEEAFAFLRAINTGHPGSMTTIHADSAASAIEQVTLLVHQAGTPLSSTDIQQFIRRTIGLSVQLARVGGRRTVAEVVIQPGA